VQATNTPIGVWATEENKGNVRVEQCGTNLCGYAEQSNERILINMKPDGAKWSGRNRDPHSGRNYDSTSAMKSPACMILAAMRSIVRRAHKGALLSMRGKNAV
jgi:uncharacterized protein (DUF2147 family)